MDSTPLENLLYRHTESERWHLDHPHELSPRYRDVPHIDVDGEEVMLFDWKDTLHERLIGMIKETRFTSVPPHVNQDMELSYVYDGACDCVVNGRAFKLRTGDVLICDAGAVRSSPSIKGEHDIVISIVFRKEFFDGVFLSRLPGAGTLTNLLFDVIARNRAHDRYLLLPAAYAGHTRTYIELLFEEYHFARMYSDELIRSLVSCLFLELIRGLHRRTMTTENEMLSNTTIAPVLAHIEQHYKDCTLSSVADAFGYNANYLSNLIREKTGHSFSEIKCEQQISEAAYLLANTSRSIAAVASKVGIRNMTYFYRKFKASYNCTPKQYRQQMARTA